jgi:MFS transporter, DHA1 family, tetracycline resistance protein
VLLSNLGLGLDYVFMALAPGLGWLFAGRLIAGITASVFPTATAYIADVTPPEGRARRFGMLGAAFGLGFIVGPAVGGFLGAIDLRLPFWVAAALSLANACYGFFVLPESLPKERRSQFQWKKANPWGALTLLRSHPLLLTLAGASFLVSLAHESLPSMFVLYTDYRYHWDSRTTGLALMAIGICSMLVSGGLVGPAVKRLGERRALVTGLCFGISGFVLYGLSSGGLGFAVGIPLLGLWGLIGPSLQALLTRHVDPAQQGRLQGALSSLRGVSGMMGPVLFTQVFSLATRGPAVRLPGAPYLLASALLAASLGLVFVAGRVAKFVSPEL